MISSSPDPVVHISLKLPIHAISLGFVYAKPIIGSYLMLACKSLFLDSWVFLEDRETILETEGNFLNSGMHTLGSIQHDFSGIRIILTL